MQSGVVRGHRLQTNLDQRREKFQILTMNQDVGIHVDHHGTKLEIGHQKFCEFVGLLVFFLMINGLRNVQQELGECVEQGRVSAEVLDGDRERSEALWKRPSLEQVAAAFNQVR